MNTKWSESLLTGHPEIDMQHREMFRQAEIFIESGRHGKSKEQLKEMLSFLEDYTNEHFKMEEALQQKYDYPDYQAHKLLHDNYRNRYLEFKKQYNSSGARYSLAINAILFTIDWLTEHINGADKSVAVYIKNNATQKNEPEVIPQEPNK